MNEEQLMVSERIEFLHQLFLLATGRDDCFSLRNERQILREVNEEIVEHQQE